MNREVGNLMQLWKTKLALLDPTGSGCFEVAKDLGFLATDIISSISFGEPYQLLERTIRLVEEEGVRTSDQPFSFDLSQQARDTVAFLDVRVSMSLPCPSGVRLIIVDPRPQAVPISSPFPGMSINFHRATSSTFRKAERSITAFVAAKVDAGRIKVRDGLAESCLLDTILRKEMEDGLQLTQQELRDELLTFLIAVSPARSTPFL